MATSALRLTLANLLIPVAILIFATGFFPYKPFMTGLAEYEELGWEDSMGWESKHAPEAPFDKLVFMVVDALRSDFVFSEESGMSFVQSLIRDGSAIPFTAHATSPTITMPRVKAMTTGSIPSFLDVILNFAESDTTSTLATQDTWLAQIKAKDYGQPHGQGTLVIYGDDTWLKLFPDFFKRADGTSSFFVSDFTEVDNNVTRHIPDELLNSDWNAMILHYLGLDHIGHKAGPKSPNMIPKQKEMDSIVRIIYEAIENEDHLSKTLFVLCGDHGMNDGGNHGGSTPGETSPALVFMSPKLKDIADGPPRESPTKPKHEGEFEYYKMIEQSDIAPTLAGLMGFPVPRNNLGVFIDQFLNFWDDRSDHIALPLRNAMQMKKIVQATYSSLSFENRILEKDEMGFQCFSPDEMKLTDGQFLACLWQRVVAALNFAAEDPQKTLPAIYEFMREAQSTLSSTASNYDVSRLNIGYALTAPVIALAYRLPRNFTVTPAGLFYTLILTMYFLLMLASSYVEEEHNFWYWMTSAWLFYLFLKEMRKEWFSTWIFHPAIMALSIHRTVRRWNQTGQKFAGADDIVTSGIFSGKNSIVLWGLVGATYLDITLRLSRHIARSIATFDDDSKSKDDEYEASDVNKIVGTLGVLPLGATAFVFKLAFTEREAPELVYGISPSLLDWASTLNLVDLARMVFGGLAMSTSWIIFAEWKRSKRRRKKGKQGNGSLAIAIFDLLTLFLLTQTKAQNIPLYLLFRLQFFFLSILNMTPTAVTVTTLLLTQTSFFALGNSNAISSIDLSNSYNGISDYNISAVGLLVFLSNWAGPLYWSVAGVILLGNHGRAQRYINTAELDTRDWVTKEHEYLNDMARKEEESRERRRDPQAWKRHAALLTLWTGLSLHAVMLACTVLRTHLFIWTVFSPKFLYAMAWGVAAHLGVTMGLGRIVWWFGGW